jgi:hypothetical protein
MSSAELANLARIGKLKPEPPTDVEIAGLLASAAERLADARRSDLAYSSRFDLAYNAAHAMALAALRRAGAIRSRPAKRRGRASSGSTTCAPTSTSR